jgi:hypothetical protein
MRDYVERSSEPRGRTDYLWRVVPCLQSAKTFSQADRLTAAEICGAECSWRSRHRKQGRLSEPASLPTTDKTKWVKRLRGLTKDIRLRIRHRRNSSFIELRVIRHQTVLQLYTACTTKDRSYVECQRPTSRARLTCGQVLRSGFFSPPNHLSADEIASD